MTTSTPTPSPRQTTPPTVEQVKACRYWWVYNSAADTNPDVCQMLVRDDEVQVQCGDEWEWIDVAFHEIAALLFAPCLPPGVEDAEIKRLREAVKAIVAGCNSAYRDPGSWTVDRDLVTALVDAIGAA